MKTLVRFDWNPMTSRLWAVCFAVLGAAIAATCHGQGSLAPPGAPGPTFKTLHQVEPRTPISTLPFTITNSGSYYLASNLAGGTGISIRTNHVALDLNGFSLVGSGSGIGILVSTPQASLYIRNGTVQGWGTGVNATNANHSQFELLRIANNTFGGLFTGDGCLVKDCVAVTNTVGEGITIASYSVIRGCIVNANRGGITAYSGCLVEGNNCSFNTFGGIRALGSGNRIDGNNVAYNINAGGVYAAGPEATNNLIIRNSARGNTPQNYNTQPNNALGSVVNGTGGITITTNSPWANFAF